MDDEEKEKVELRSLKAVHDSFRKIVISNGKSWSDDYGILRLGLLDFLLDEGILDK
jgi:hypothetical protein